jgi:hypothetical protein
MLVDLAGRHQGSTSNVGIEGRPQGADLKGRPWVSTLRLDRTGRPWKPTAGYTVLADFTGRPLG